jgi:hypothetical protein
MRLYVNSVDLRAQSHDFQKRQAVPILVGRIDPQGHTKRRKNVGLYMIPAFTLRRACEGIRNFGISHEDPSSDKITKVGAGQFLLDPPCPTFR